jgi:hypothetical protein
MIKNYQFPRPRPQTIEFSDCIMHFPYGVIHAVEMDDRVILLFALPLPANKRDDGIWCYRKPLVRTTAHVQRGSLWWRVDPPLDPTGDPWPMPYYTLDYWEERQILYATSMYIGYAIDPDTGKSTFITTFK